MVLRSLYLDPALDSALGTRAEAEGITKAELMRRFLVEGLARPAGRLVGYQSTGKKPARSSSSRKSESAEPTKGRRAVASNRRS